MKASLAAHETIPALLYRAILPFRRPARERNHVLPGRARGPGGGPSQNSLRDVGQQQPAILFSIHRRVAKLSDGADLHVRRNHPSAGAASAAGSGSPKNPAGVSLFVRHIEELRSDAHSVQGRSFTMRNRQLLSAQLLAEARGWAEELTQLEIKGPFDLEDAWRRLETRHGVPVATFYSLRYRKDLKDIWCSLHRMLQMAVEQERSRRAAQLSHHRFIESTVSKTG